MPKPAPMDGAADRCIDCGTPVPSRGDTLRVCPRCVFGIALNGVDGADRGPDDDTTSFYHAVQRPLSPEALNFFSLGDYELVEEIARGGMGVVFRARQRSLRRDVALKVILNGKFASAEMIRRFKVEAEAAALLDHPNIVPIHEVGETEGQHFFSMRLIEGESLSRRLAKQSDPIPERQSAAWMLTLADAVQHAHSRGVLHRDLKPGNVLIDRSNELHLTDFGLARLFLTDSNHTVSGAAIGTPAYMSPEQAGGRSREITTATDVWSLGAIFYELLTGRTPFAADSHAQIIYKVLHSDPRPPHLARPGVDPGLSAICMHCLEKESELRYPTAAALARDLERWLGGDPLTVRPENPVQRGVRWARRRPAIVALAGVGLVAALALGWGILERRLAGSLASQKQRFEYLAEMKLAQQAWASGNYGYARRLLERQIPAKGRSDIRGAEWHLLQALTEGQQTALLKGASSSVMSVQPALGHVAWVADGAVVRADETGRIVARVPLPADATNAIRCLSWPDPGVLLAGGYGGLFRHEWEADGWKRVSFDPVDQIFASPISRTPLLLLGPDGMPPVVLEDAGIRKFSSDGARLPDAVLAARYDAVVGTWICHDKRQREYPVHQIPGRDAVAKGSELIAACWSPDGRYLATVNWRGHLRVVDESKGRKQTLEHSGLALANVTLAFSHDSKHLAIAGTPTPRILIFELETGRVRSSMDGHLEGITHVAFLNPATLVSGSRDASVRWWKAFQPESPIRDFPHQLRGMEPLAPIFSFDEKWWAATESDLDGSTTAIRRLSEVEENPALPVVRRVKGRPISFSPHSDELTLWNPGGVVTTLRTPFDSEAAAIRTNLFSLYLGDIKSTDGTFSICLDSNDVAHVVRWVDSVRLATSGIRPVWKLALSPDDVHIAVASTNAVHLWNWRTGDTRAVLPTAAYDVAFSPDGRWLAAGGADSKVSLYDLREGKSGPVLAGHQGTVGALGFAPDGTLVTGGDDRTLRFWSLETGHEAMVFDVRDPIYWIRVSPRGRWLVTGSVGDGSDGNRGAYHLWPIRAERVAGLGP